MGVNYESGASGSIWHTVSLKSHLSSRLPPFPVLGGRLMGDRLGWDPGLPISVLRAAAPCHPHTNHRPDPKNSESLKVRPKTARGQLALWWEQLQVGPQPSALGQPVRSWVPDPVSDQGHLVENHGNSPRSQAQSLQSPQTAPRGINVGLECWSGHISEARRGHTKMRVSEGDQGLRWGEGRRAPRSSAVPGVGWGTASPVSP